MPGAASIARVLVASSALVACGALVSIEGYDLAPGGVVIGADGGPIVGGDGAARPDADGSTITPLDLAGICNALVAYETFEGELHVRPQASTGANSATGKFGTAQAYSPATGNQSFSIDKDIGLDMARGSFVFWLYADGWIPCKDTSGPISVSGADAAHTLSCDGNGTAMTFFGWRRRVSSVGADSIELPSSGAQKTFLTAREGWSLVAMTWNETSGAIYVNGLYQSAPTTSVSSTQTTSIDIRGLPAIPGPTIRLDEMRLFNRSLTQVELDYIWATELAGTSTLEKNCPAK